MKIFNFFSRFSLIALTKNNIKFIIIGFVLYGFFLITTLPASIVFSVIKLPENIKLTSISGSIWSGKALRFQLSGIELGELSWKLHPLNLLLGEISANISVANNEQYIKSEINFTTSGKVTLEETRFKIDLSSLAPLTYGMPVTYSGIASGYFPVSFFHKNNYVGVNGKLSLSKIELISPQRQYFGDFVVQFRAENEGATSGKIKDVSGELNVDGQLKLTKTGQFSVSAKISARKTGSSLDQMLAFFGKKDTSGQVQVMNNFKLWN